MSTTNLSLASQIFGVSGSLLLAGGIASLSHITIPSLLFTTQFIPTRLIIKTWAKVYHIGSLTAPPLALVSALSLLWASNTAPSSTSSKLFAAAAASTATIVPFTLLAMKGVNGSLHELEVAVDSPEVEVKGKELLKSWTRLNFIRSLFTLIGGLLGLWAVLETSKHKVIERVFI